MIRKPVSIHKRKKCDSHQEALLMGLVTTIWVTEFGD